MNKRALIRTLGIVILILIVIFAGLLILTDFGRIGMIRYNPYVYFDPNILFDIDRVPDYSDNFDEAFISSFEDNYEPNHRLGFYSASVWEAEIEKKIDIFNHKDRFSMIDGFESKDFVVRSQVSRTQFPALADVSCELSVYCHKDAPDPMTDWTIKSLSVIEVDFYDSLSSTLYETETDTKYRPDKFKKDYIHLEELAVSQMSLFDTDENRICFFDRESDPALIELIEKGYAAPAKIEDRFSLTRQVDEDGSLMKYVYYIVIGFEENDNIVWFCELERDQYYKALYIDPARGLGEKIVIDGEYAEEIFSAIFPIQ